MTMKTTKTRRFEAAGTGERYEARGTWRRGSLVSVMLLTVEGDDARLYDVDARPEASALGAAAWLALETGCYHISKAAAEERSAQAQRAKGWS